MQFENQQDTLRPSLKQNNIKAFGHLFSLTASGSYALNIAWSEWLYST